MRAWQFIQPAIAAVIVCLPTFAADARYRDAKPIPHAHNALDVTYRPNRITGAVEDRWVKLNVHWPKDAKPDQRYPFILFVHGGGYGGGDKDQNFCKDAMHKALQQGFAVGNLNYILGRDIFPQVFYDYHAAVRFLRKNARKYHINPNRMGAWGFSAGGWLSSSATFCEPGDLLELGTKSATTEWLPITHERNEIILRRIARPDKKGNLRPALPMHHPRPIYSSCSARIQALQADFNQFENNLSPATPAICTYVGIGGVSKLDQPAKAAGVTYFPLEIDHPRKKWKGARAVHVPDLKTPTPSPIDGKPIELSDRVLLWFKKVLVYEAATPVPEIRPNRRVFTDKTQIQIVMPTDDAAVHYTMDGTEPTKRSPKWTAPIAIDRNMTFKAFAVRPGMQPSRVATARFIKGRVPPTITGPNTLPASRVEQPFSVRFTVNSDDRIFWHLSAHHKPQDHRTKVTFAEYSGLSFDQQTGVLSGTPKRTGVYTLQVHAAWKPGELADVRTYMLRVHP